MDGLRKMSRREAEEDLFGRVISTPEQLEADVQEYWALDPLEVREDVVVRCKDGVTWEEKL